MEFKTTQKNVKQSYDHVLCVGYCDLQHLLNHCPPAAYTTRREGWGADIYSFGNIAIATGYAPFGDIKVSYDLCQKYEQKALKIRDSIFDYDKIKEETNKLIADFIIEATKAKEV